MGSLDAARRVRKLPSAVFSHFELNKDPEASKYMPYNEVAHPNLLQPLGASLESMWMAGHLDEARQTELKRVTEALNPFLQLPGSTMLPGAVAAQRAIDRKRSAPRRIETRRPLSDDEELRLRALSKALMAERHKPNPYAVANRKIRRACAMRRPPKVALSLEHRAVRTLLMRSRTESDAAAVIGIAWRRHARRRRLAERRLRESVVVSIQACGRSFVARRLVAVWWTQTERLAVLWQSQIRRSLAVRRAAAYITREYWAAASVQRLVRTFLADRRVRRARRDCAATRIQKVIRGAWGRVKADKVWLPKQIIQSQAVIRSALTRRRSAALKQTKTKAALVIERCYRGFLARQTRHRLLTEREDEARTALLRELADDALRLQDRITAIRKQAKQRRLAEHVDEARQRVDAMTARVVEAETAYFEAKAQHDTCTPRSAAAGWLVELERYMVDHRDSITDAKTALLFDGLLPLARAKREHAEMRQAVDRAMFLQGAADDARTAELKTIWARENRRIHDTEAKLKRQRIGDQRRAWRVKFYNESGKPRKSLNRWFVSPERNKARGTVVPLDDGDDPGRGGLRAGLARAQASLQVQNYMNQVAHFDTLFAPFFEPFLRATKPNLDEEEEAPKPEETAVVSTAQPESADTWLVPVEPPSQSSEADDTRHSPSVAETVSAADSAPSTRRRRRPWRIEHARIPWSLLDELDAEKVRHCLSPTHAPRRRKPSRPSKSSTKPSADATESSTTRRAAMLWSSTNASVVAVDT